MTAPTVRVSDDPRVLADVRAEADRRADAQYPRALARVRAGEWVFSEQRDALRHRRDRAAADLRAVLADSTVKPAGRVSAAITLAELGLPDGADAMLAFLSDPSPELRSAALVKLRRFEGRNVDLSPPDRAARVLALLDDPDPGVALAAATVAAERRLPGAADRVAARLASGSVTKPRAWAVHMDEVGDAPAQAQQ